MIGIPSALSIRARGQRPLLEAVYMTAPRFTCRNTKNALAERGPSIHDGLQNIIPPRRSKRSRGKFRTFLSVSRWQLYRLGEAVPNTADDIRCAHSRMQC